MSWDKREFKLLLSVLVHPTIWVRRGRFNAQWDEAVRATLDAGHVPLLVSPDKICLNGMRLYNYGARDHLEAERIMCPSRRTSMLLRLTLEHELVQSATTALNAVCNELVMGTLAIDKLSIDIDMGHAMPPVQPDTMLKKTFGKSIFDQPYVPQQGQINNLETWIAGRLEEHQRRGDSV